MLLDEITTFYVKGTVTAGTDASVLLIEMDVSITHLLPIHPGAGAKITSGITSQW